MQPKTHIFKTTDLLADYLGKQVILLCTTKEKVYISLSGGSTPKQIFEYWSNTLADKIPWNKIFFFWGDERYVPHTDPLSNYNMTNQALLGKVTIPSENIFRIKTELSIEAAVLEYSQQMYHTVPLHNQIPQFDFIFLGLGEDGHTASIFPHEMALWNNPNLCTIATHPNGQKRISITGAVINNAQKVYFLVTGKQKKERVEEIIHQKGDYQKYPASLVKAIKTEWLLDTEAGEYLKNH